MFYILILIYSLKTKRLVENRCVIYAILSIVLLVMLIIDVGSTSFYIGSSKAAFPPALAIWDEMDPTSGQHVCATAVSKRKQLFISTNRKI